MKQAKILLGGALSALLLSTLAGCAGGGDQINIISREDGSGTRSAFVELFGIEEKDTAGNRVDNTTDRAEITSSTAVMMTSVSGDPNAIGYLSLGSLSSSVKPLKIDGVAPSLDTVKDGSYKIARPFHIATRGALSPAAQDFVTFIVSAEGQAVVEAKGYIAVTDAGPFVSALPAGKVVVAGSSSVTPVMEALKEAYATLNPDASIEIQQSDSTTGMNAVAEGICEIGMASRALKDSELTKGIESQTIALDGIVVIVNLDNPISNLSASQVKEIYTGAVTLWGDLG